MFFQPPHHDAEHFLMPTHLRGPSAVDFLSPRQALLTTNLVPVTTVLTRLEVHVNDSHSMFCPVALPRALPTVGPA